jgi:hypothetical protein
VQMDKKITGGFPSAFSSAYFIPIADFDAETDSNYSLIQVELGNGREDSNEAGTYCVDVLRFLNGFPAENEIILLHAASNGTLLRDSAPVIPSKRYRIRCCGEKIKNGDIFQVRLLVRGGARLADGIR